MLRRPPSRIELKSEDKEEFELLRRDYLATRELGAPTTPQDTADRARLAREHERARRLGLNRSLQPPPQ